MKKALLALLLPLVFATAAHAQAPAGYAALPIDSATQKVTYRGAIALPPGTTQAQAYGRAKLWLADVFASKALIADDAASGLLSGGGIVLVRDFSYLFRVRLQVESNQVRYRLDDFTWQTNGGRSTSDRGTAEEQRDSKMGIGKGLRAKMLAEMDAKVREGLAKLKSELGGNL